MKRTYNYFPANDNIGYALAVDAIKVHHLSSPRTGEPVKNQFVIAYHSALVRKFQSYDTICMGWDGCSRVLTVYPEAFGYSVTTSRYSKVFLREEIGLAEADILEVVKMAKTEAYGRDCPLFIEF